MGTAKSSRAQEIGTNNDMKDPEAGNSTPDGATAKAPMASEQPSKKVSDCSEMKRKRVECRTFLLIVLLIIFLCCMASLVASFTLHKFGNHVIWVLKLWQWCVLGSVILCGLPLIILMLKLVVLLIRGCLVIFIKIDVHYGYYIYGLEKTVGVLLWFGSVLLTWSLLLESSEVKTSKHASQILNGITKTLATFIIGAFLWLLKNLFLNMLSYSFQVRRFDWIKKSLVNQHILEVFQSSDQRKGLVQWIIDKVKGQSSGEGLDEITDIDRLNNLDLNEMSAGTMHCLIERIIRSNLSCITKELEDFVDKEDIDKLYDADELKEAATKLILEPDNARSKANPGDKHKDKREEITAIGEKIQVSKGKEISRVENSEHSNSSSKANPGDKHKDKREEITAIGEKTQVSKGKETSRVENSEHSNSRCINKTDVEELFTEKAAAYVIQRINGYLKSENIDGKALTKWLVNATIERKTLIQSLKDTKSAIKKLNLLIIGIVLFLLFIIWLLILRILTTKVLILLLSQSFALTFMLGSIAKGGLEGIIFVFVMHPFDIGDLCLINGEEMVVDKVNLSTTVFRKRSKEKIIYPNSVLTTMPIKNFYWGTADVKDSLEFTIKEDTTDVQRKELYNRIKGFMASANNSWIPAATISALKGIEEKKVKMVLYFTCRDVNVQRCGHRMVWRRHLLIAELKKICEDLKIECNDIRPQAVDLSFSAFVAPVIKA